MALVLARTDAVAPQFYAGLHPCQHSGVSCQIKYPDKQPWKDPPYSYRDCDKGKNDPDCCDDNLAHCHRLCKDKYELLEDPQSILDWIDCDKCCDQKAEKCKDPNAGNYPKGAWDPCAKAQRLDEPLPQPGAGAGGGGTPPPTKYKKPDDPWK